MEECSCEPAEPIFSVAEDRNAGPEEGSWENTMSSTGGDWWPLNEDGEEPSKGRKVSEFLSKRNSKNKLRCGKMHCRYKKNI